MWNHSHCVVKEVNPARRKHGRVLDWDHECLGENGGEQTPALRSGQEGQSCTGTMAGI